MVAATNAFGWGRLALTDTVPGGNAAFESPLGYEAISYAEYRGNQPQCFMLAGVTAGLMALTFGTGTLEERVGSFRAEESICLACGGDTCRFEVKKAS
jgi:hypothetical protein